MRTREHTEHSFTRLLSERADGLALFGCSHGSRIAGCAATEVRRKEAPSPFAMKRHARAAQKAKAAVTA